MLFHRIKVLQADNSVGLSNCSVMSCLISLYHVSLNLISLHLLLALPLFLPLYLPLCLSLPLSASLYLSRSTFFQVMARDPTNFESKLRRMVKDESLLGDAMKKALLYYREQQVVIGGLGRGMGGGGREEGRKGKGRGWRGDKGGGVECKY